MSDCDCGRKLDGATYCENCGKPSDPAQGRDLTFPDDYANGKPRNVDTRMDEYLKATDPAQGVKRALDVRKFTFDGEEFVRASDYATLSADKIAAEAELERVKEKADKFMLQVRDTCTRAEAAETRCTSMREALEKIADRKSWSTAGDSTTWVGSDHLTARGFVLEVLAAIAGGKQ